MCQQGTGEIAAYRNMRRRAREYGCSYCFHGPDECARLQVTPDGSCGNATGKLTSAQSPQENGK